MRTRPLLLLLLSALLLVACRPTPNDPIEYLHREDSIIIQVLSVDDDAAEIERRYPVPELTLYGDGTLIYQSVNADGTRLLETTLPEDAVQELLEDIVDEGFLNFLYEQPAPEGASRVTTFVYAHTRDLANAVSIRGAGEALPVDAGGGFDQYRTVQEFIETLRSLDPVALGGRVPTVYMANRHLKFTHLEDDPDGPGDPQVTDPPAMFGRRDTLEGLLGITVDVIDGVFHQFSYVPLLPFYENFPEFNLQ